jgi:prophage antirepressor-like protein
MGIELDVLVGHPEHDLLFIATQVGRAAGLADPKRLTQATKGQDGTLQLRGLAPKVENLATIELYKTHGKRYMDAWLFPEPVVYQMLLRGHAPASEPFRKWVTEVVLPSIRKTGKFDVNEATDETSQQFAGEFAAVHAALCGFRDEVMGKITSLEELIASSASNAGVPSPYDKTTQSSPSDGLLFDKRTLREVGESVVKSIDRSLHEGHGMVYTDCRYP